MNFSVVASDDFEPCRRRDPQLAKDRPEGFSDSDHWGRPSALGVAMVNNGVVNKKQQPAI